MLKKNEVTRSPRSGLRKHSKGTRTGVYRSPLEAKVVKTIPKKKGIKVLYEGYQIPYQVDYTYTPDFTIRLPSGKSFIVEVKGWFKYEDKVKMKAVKVCNPELDIRMVFQSKSKKDIRWCEKHGFLYAVGEIPSEWLVDGELING